MCAEAKDGVLRVRGQVIANAGVTTVNIAAVVR